MKIHRFRLVSEHAVLKLQKQCRDTGSLDMRHQDQTHLGNGNHLLSAYAQASISHLNQR